MPTQLITSLTHGERHDTLDVAYFNSDQIREMSSIYAGLTVQGWYYLDDMTGIWEGPFKNQHNASFARDRL